MKKVLLASLVLVSLVMSLALVLFIAGCGKTHKQAAKPVYRAHITNMVVSGLTATTKPAIRSALVTGITTSATSVQDFYSGDLVNTADVVGVDVSVQNDSEVPMNIFVMTYWAPPAYPYSDTLANKSMFQACRSGLSISPGTVLPISMRFGLWVNDPSLLGSQQISAYVYASADPVPMGCQPDPWDGTLVGMQNYIATHDPLVTGTNHFTIVVP